MGTPVNLRALADEIDSALEEMDVYLNTKTAEIAAFSDFWGLDEGDTPDLEAPHWVCVDRPDADEAWRMMADFAAAQADKKVGEDLWAALNQSHPFRRFRERVHRPGLIDEWYAHRTAAFVDYTRAWLEQEGYAYTESSESVV